MIKNTEKLEAFEKWLIQRDPVDVRENFRLVEAMYDEAFALNIIPMKDPLDGLEVDLKIAKVVNHVPEASRRHRKQTG